MGNNKFKQLCGYVDYNTYNKIQNILGFSSFGMSLTNGLIQSQYQTSNSLFDILVFFSFATYLGLTLSHGKNYTRDIKQIRILYQEFITNYNRLNKVFDLNDPIQIHAMFNYLLYKGYLSIDKNFEFSNENVRDIDGICGTNVIAGTGVCRHISAMLTDILNNYGIEANQLGVYSMDYSIDTLRMIKDKKILNKKPGNHTITFLVKDGKSYYLDPTQGRIYRVSENDKKLLCDDKGEIVPIKLLSTIVLNGFKDYLVMREKLLQQYLNVTKEEEKQMIKQTIVNCKNNMDIFERFYSENNDLYRDISSKMLQIKIL